VISWFVFGVHSQDGEARQQKDDYVVIIMPTGNGGLRDGTFQTPNAEMLSSHWQRVFAQSKGLSASSGPPDPVKHIYPLLGGYLAQMTDEQIQIALSDPEFIVSLEKDSTITLPTEPDILNVKLDSVVHPNTFVSPWGLRRIKQRTSPFPPNDPNPMPFRGGDGVSIFVVDTGVYHGHLEFQGKLLKGASFVDGEETTEDFHGHGSHVTSIVGGATFGIAPDSTIVPVKVLNGNGSGEFSQLIQGLEYVLKQHLDQKKKAPTKTIKSIINMSLSLGQSSNLMDGVLKRFIDEEGIVVVVAAGNEHRDACLASPGSCEECITVAATDANDVQTSFSNYGSCVDLYAPGEDILGAYHKAPYRQSMSGTSMAAPHVTGVLANIWSMTDFTPQELKQVLLLGTTKDVVKNISQGSPNRVLFQTIFPGDSGTPNSCDLTILWIGLCMVVAASLSLLLQLFFWFKSRRTVALVHRSEEELGLLSDAEQTNNFNHVHAQ
jgi:subtilisin family serine protease